MPTHPIVVSGAIVVISVAVAAAIAVYESPQVRQYAEDVRRRIAIALHSLGDEINPPPQQPRFNRPEDAEGFMQSSAEPGVDADEESKRRQREELMYWNAVRLEKLEKDREIAAAAGRPANKRRGSSFEDFLDEDHTAEKGTYVYNTGTDVRRDAEEGLRRRGQGVQGLDRRSIYTNPFADEHNIDMDEQRAIDASLMSPPDMERCDVLSDIYSANEGVRPSRQSTATLLKEEPEQLVDTSDPPVSVHDPVSYPSMAQGTHESTSFMAAQAMANSAFASIHAWADNANNSFYSPLPGTPRSATPQQARVAASWPIFNDVPGSPLEPDHSSGEATPTDSASLAGSGEEVWQPRSGATSDVDVVSVDGEGISTPGSWTEVGSVVSENDVESRH